jgi:hypothetical protein
VAESEASGNFDYLWDDPAEVGGLTSHDARSEGRPAAESEDPLNGPVDDLWDDPDDNFWDNPPDVDESGHFDAFNFDAFDDNTWTFTPAPPPWYRTKQAMTAIVAASAAVAAIVVSGVLLVFRGDGGAAHDVTSSSVTPTAPTSAAPVQVASSDAPPPELPPPPPPPAETASPVNQAPRSNPTYEPRPSKAPEIGVTRTPVTRLPISVAPQPRSGHH